MPVLLVRPRWRDTVFAELFLRAHSSFADRLWRAGGDLIPSFFLAHGIRLPKVIRHQAGELFRSGMPLRARYDPQASLPRRPTVRAPSWPGETAISVPTPAVAANSLGSGHISLAEADQ